MKLNKRAYIASLMSDIERVKLKFELMPGQSREKSLTITKLDEAVMWARRILCGDDATIEVGEGEEPQ